MKNLVIAIGREYGSCGSAVAKELSRLMGIKLYDKELIQLVAENSGYATEVLKDIDETASSSLLYSLSMNAGGHIALGQTMPLSDKAFIICSDIIRDLAEKESCIILGRCADSILKELDNLLTVFIHTDIENRIDRICELEKCSRGEASNMVKKTDRKRSAYHNYYADTKWGDRKSYDLCIDSKIGIEKAAELIKFAAENR